MNFVVVICIIRKLFQQALKGNFGIYVSPIFLIELYGIIYEITTLMLSLNNIYKLRKS